MKIHYDYCPIHGIRLMLKEAGDDGMIPYCPECRQYYFDSFPSCVIVLTYNDQNEVILSRSYYLSKIYWTYTSGYITPGESAEECAVREVKEELNIDIDHLEPAGTYYYEKGGILMIGFLAHAKTTEVKLSSEVNEYMWVKPEEVPSYLFPEEKGNATHPMLMKFLTKIR